MRFTGVCKGIVVSVLLASPLMASQTHHWASDFQRLCYAGAGWANVDLSSLNETMATLELPAFSSKPLSLEVGKHLLIQDLVLEASVGGLIWRNRYENNREASLFGISGNLLMGVSFNMPGETWKVYPFFSLGGTLLRFSHNTAELEFTSDKKASSDVYWLPTFLTGFGGAVMRVFHLERSKKVFTMGLKGGIQVDPSQQSTWFGKGVRFRNGPSPLLSGPFLQLIIGKGNYVSG